MRKESSVCPAHLRLRRWVPRIPPASVSFSRFRPRDLHERSATAFTVAAMSAGLVPPAPCGGSCVQIRADFSSHASGTLSRRRVALQVGVLGATLGMHRRLGCSSVMLSPPATSARASVWCSGPTARADEDPSVRPLPISSALTTCSSLTPCSTTLVRGCGCTAPPSPAIPMRCRDFPPQGRGPARTYRLDVDPEGQRFHADGARA